MNKDNNVPNSVVMMNILMRCRSTSPTLNKPLIDVSNRQEKNVFIGKKSFLACQFFSSTINLKAKVLLIFPGKQDLTNFFPGNVKPCLSVKNDETYSSFSVI